MKAKMHISFLIEKIPNENLIKNKTNLALKTFEVKNK